MAETEKKKSPASHVQFRSVDDLFVPTAPVRGASQAAKPLEGLQELNLDELHAFKDHPFRMYAEEKMQEMVESIKEHGIISPILVRPNKTQPGYEIISGHNRAEACRRAGLVTIPANIRDLDDDTAIILMVDSNLRQRDKLLPSEKAKAYQMKMDAMKRQGQRNDLTSGQVGPKLEEQRVRTEIGQEAGDSGRQVQRFMRLNNLIPELQEAVDSGKLAMTPAVEISYLNEQQQSLVAEVMETQCMSPALAQAQRLHKISKDEDLDETAIEAVLLEEKPMYETITFRKNNLEKYFPEGTTGKQMQDIILNLLEEYQKTREELTQSGTEIEI